MKPTLFCLLLLCLPIQAQQLVFGQIHDAEFNTPLPYVNIGIPDQGIGTVSDEEGYYQLEIPDNLSSASILFSMVGFAKVEREIASLEKGDEKLLSLKLQPEVTALKEVIVTDTQWRPLTVGNKTTSKRIVGGFTSNHLGNEIAQFIRVKKNSPTLLKKFWLSIAENNIQDVILRFNVYNEVDGFPGDNLLAEAVYISLPNGSETIIVDLSPYDIYVEDNFFISIEWIEDLGIENLWFSAGVFGKSVYARSTSQSKWVRQKALSIGMGVELLHKGN
jgi:hypothetical protein